MTSEAAVATHVHPSGDPAPDRDAGRASGTAAPEPPGTGHEGHSAAAHRPAHRRGPGHRASRAFLSEPDGNDTGAVPTEVAP
ncbi:hypothetical protein ACFZAU_30475 [Streptomyces sp. NPDC008238]